jgi:hypothetical protein
MDNIKIFISGLIIGFIACYFYNQEQSNPKVLKEFITVKKLQIDTIKIAEIKYKDKKIEVEKTLEIYYERTVIDTFCDETVKKLDTSLKNCDSLLQLKRRLINTDSKIDSIKIENNENVYSIFNRISILYHSVFSNRKRNEERRTSGIRKNYRNPNNRC